MLNSATEALASLLIWLVVRAAMSAVSIAASWSELSALSWLLVSALIGRQRLLDLYEQAKAEGYRFFSYGDAMWIAPEAVIEEARP